MKNVTATGNKHTHIDTLKAGEDTISKILAKLYTKCLSERRIPTAWKNYEKGFDSVQTQAVLTLLQEQGIEDVNIELLKEIYTNSSVRVHLQKYSNKINTRRGVGQGGTKSPKQFTTALESIFRRLEKPEA